MLVKRRKMIVAEQNRNRAWRKMRGEMIQSETAELSGILDINKVKNVVNVIHQLLLFRSDRTPAANTIFDLFLTKLKQLYVLVVLRHPGERCMYFARR